MSLEIIEIALWLRGPSGDLFTGSHVPALSGGVMQERMRLTGWKGRAICQNFVPDVDEIIKQLRLSVVKRKSDSSGAGWIVCLWIKCSRVSLYFSEICEVSLIPFPLNSFYSLGPCCYFVFSVTAAPLILNVTSMHIKLITWALSWMILSAWNYILCLAGDAASISAASTGCT